MEASDDESMLLLLILAPLLFFLFLKSCGKKHTNRDDEQRKKMVRQKADDRAEVVISSLSKPSTVSHRKESHGRQFEGIECEESEVPSEGIELENDRGRKESSSLLQESGENYSEEEEFPSLGKEQGRSPVLKGGTLVGQDRFKSAREFLSSSESVFQRLIKDGFSARAAIRSLLHHAESSSKVSSVSSTFYDCMTWICQSAAIIDVNAPWREEEILMIGEEYLQRFSDIENDLLRKYAHNSILNPKDDMLQSEQKIEREKSEEPLLRHETEQVIEAGKDDQNDWNVVLADDELNEDTVETNCEVDELEALKLEILDKTGFRVSDAVSFDDLLSSLNAKMCEAMTEDFWGVKYKSIPSQPDQIVKIAGGRRSEIALLVCFRVWQKLDCMSPACAAVARLSVMVNVGTLFKQGTLPLPPDVVPPVSSTDNLSSDLGRETAFLFQHENFSKDVFQSLSHPQSLSSCFFSQHLPCSLISINVEERMLPALLAVARGVWEEEEQQQGRNRRVDAIGRSMREALLRPAWIKIFSESTNLLASPQPRQEFSTSAICCMLGGWTSLAREGREDNDKSRRFLLLSLFGLKSALNLRDADLRSSFFQMAAKLFQCCQFDEEKMLEDSKSSHASPEAAALLLSFLLALLCEPFAAPHSALHRNWSRLDPSSFIIDEGQEDPLGKKKQVSSKEVKGQQDKFLMSGEEAEEIAEAICESAEVVQEEEEEEEERQTSFISAIWPLFLLSFHKCLLPAFRLRKQTEGRNELQALLSLLFFPSRCLLVAPRGSAVEQGGTQELVLRLVGFCLSWIASFSSRFESDGGGGGGGGGGGVQERALETREKLCFVPSCILRDCLQFLNMIWMDEHSFLCESVACPWIVDSFPYLLSRAGGLVSNFLRYRLGEFLFNLYERDDSQRRPAWDSRLYPISGPQGNVGGRRRRMWRSLAEVYCDVQGILSSEAHVFDKNVARYKLGCLLLLFSRDEAEGGGAAGAGCGAQLFSPVRQPSAGGGGGGGGAFLLDEWEEEELVETLLDDVLSDCVFVVSDALSRLADIASIQREQKDDRWLKLQEQERRDRLVLLGQLQGIARHFLNLTRRSMELVRRLLLFHDVQETFGRSQKMGSKLAGFFCSCASQVCGEGRERLLVEDASSYGLLPSQLMESFALLLLQLRGADTLRAALRARAREEAGGYDHFLRLLRSSSSLSEEDISSLLSLLPSDLHSLPAASSASSEPEGQEEVAEEKAWEPEEADRLLYSETMKHLSFRNANMAGEEERYVGHSFRHEIAGSKLGASRRKVKRLVQELHALAQAGSLPSSPAAAIFLLVDETRMDVAQVAISGPTGSPYALGLFLFDVFFPDLYPDVPPLLLLRTTGNGLVRFNPNLYSDGKVCLSLLGTWHGEAWNPSSSTFLQVLVSIQSLILVDQPYFNEPGYELQKSSPEGRRRSREYNDTIRLNTVRYAMLEHLRNPPMGFEDLVRAHFKELRNFVLGECRRWARESLSSDIRRELHVLTDQLEEEISRLP